MKRFFYASVTLTLLKVNIMFTLFVYIKYYVYLYGIILKKGLKI